MNIYEQIQKELSLLSNNPKIQIQVLRFLQKVRKIQPSQNNVKKVLAGAGTFDDETAQEIKDIIEREFGKIEEDW